MIYYWPGADNPHPSGGFKTHYLHVEALQALGIPAAVLQHEPGWRPPWFETTAPIAYLPTTTFSPDDVIVTNEIMGPRKAVEGVKTVVFNQNVHYTFRHYPTPPPPGTYTPYLDPDVLGTLVCSYHDAEPLRRAFPRHDVSIIPHGFPPERYRVGVKRRQIAFMPRKHADEAQVVFGFLSYRGALDGWDVVPIDGRTEAEAFTILGESLLFFAFGYPEGYTLPPFEAMALGCGVVGYGGFSADKPLTQFLGARVESANTMAFVETAAPILAWSDEKIARWGLDSRARVLGSLTPARQRDALASFWRSHTNVP